MSGVLGYIQASQQSDCAQLSQLSHPASSQLPHASQPTLPRTSDGVLPRRAPGLACADHAHAGAQKYGTMKAHGTQTAPPDPPQRFSRSRRRPRVLFVVPGLWPSPGGYFTGGRWMNSVVIYMLPRRQADYFLVFYVFS